MLQGAAGFWLLVGAFPAAHLGKSGTRIAP